MAKAKSNTSAVAAAAAEVGVEDLEAGRGAHRRGR